MNATSSHCGIMLQKLNLFSRLFRCLFALSSILLLSCQQKDQSAPDLPKNENSSLPVSALTDEEQLNRPEAQQPKRPPLEGEISEPLNPIQY